MYSAPLQGITKQDNGLRIAITFFFCVWFVLDQTIKKTNNKNKNPTSTALRWIINVQTQNDANAAKSATAQNSKLNPYRHSSCRDF